MCGAAGTPLDPAQPPFEDFSADFRLPGHFYAEALCHAAQDPATGRPVPTTLHGVCPRKDVLQAKRPAPPRLFAFAVAFRAANAGALVALEAALVAAGVDAAAAAAACAGAFRDVAVQAHAGTPVSQRAAHASIRHSDTVMSLVHLSVSLQGRRGVVFEVFPAAGAGKKQFTELVLDPRASTRRGWGTMGRARSGRLACCSPRGFARRRLSNVPNGVFVRPVPGEVEWEGRIPLAGAAPHARYPAASAATIPSSHTLSWL